MSFHRNLTYVDAHVPHSWEWADETARLAEVVTAANIGMLGWQQDDDTFWILTGVSPDTWAATIHSHTNKSILDLIEEPFLTADKASYDALVAAATDPALVNGFSATVDTVISIDEETLTFSIAPLVTDYSFYANYVKYTKSAQEDIVWTDENGSHHFYFDNSGVIQHTTSFPDEIILSYCYIASIYWNVADQKAILFSDERHGFQMSPPTHFYLHHKLGTAHVSGLDISNISVDGGTSLNQSAQIGFSDGTYLDEDLRFETVNGSPQTIRTVGEIPILYRNTANIWHVKGADTFPLIQSGAAGYTGVSGRIAYNFKSGVNYSLQEVPEDGYVLVHYYATDDVRTPIMGVLGTTAYASEAEIQLGVSDELSEINISGLPMPEFVLIASVAFKTNSTYTNTVKAIVSSVNGVDYFDWLDPATSSLTDHGNLSGLSDDDHPQYHNDTRGDLRYAPIAHSDGTNEQLHRITYKPSTLVQANMTAVSWDFLIVDTRTNDATINVTLPASPTVGDKVLIVDGARYFDQRSCFALTGSNLLRRANDDLEIDLRSRWVEFTFVGGTTGWEYRSDA